MAACHSVQKAEHTESWSEVMEFPDHLPSDTGLSSVNCCISIGKCRWARLGGTVNYLVGLAEKSSWRIWKRIETAEKNVDSESRQISNAASAASWLQNMSTLQGCSSTQSLRDTARVNNGTRVKTLL